MIPARYLLLLFLASCAANQSALPEAPAFEAFETAPHTTGMPGLGKEAPLLKTEPPFPVRAGTAPDPTVLGIKVPVPADALESTPVNQCLARIHKALQNDATRRQTINAASEEKRRCMVHSMLASCLLEFRDIIEQAQNSGAELSKSAVDALYSVEELAQRRKGRSCSGGIIKTYTSEEHDAWVQITKAIGDMKDQ